MCGLKKMFQEESRRNLHQKAEKFFLRFTRLEKSVPILMNGMICVDLAAHTKGYTIITSQRENTPLNRSVIDHHH